MLRRLARLAKYVALVLVLLAAASTARADSPTLPYAPPFEYTIVIDTTFNEREIRAIGAAAQDWMDAVANLKITLFVAACAGFKTDVAFCIQPQHEEDMACGRHHIGCWTGIDHVIALDKWALGLSDLRKTARHEIGHGLGLDHNTVGTTMAKRLDHQSANITCRDVRMYWIAHSARGPCKN